MNGKDLIKAFVSKRDMEDNRESCLVKVLEESRSAYKHKATMAHFVEIFDEKPESKEELEKLSSEIADISFLSVVGYLIFLDLIGEVFVSKTKGNNINNAIDSFGSEELKTVKWTVKALRNSLVHNYGLINIPDKDNHDSESLHKFILTNHGECSNIFENGEKWDRHDWKNKQEITSTTVNLAKLIEEIEKIYEEVKKQVLEDRLGHKLGGGDEELLARFTIIRS